MCGGCAGAPPDWAAELVSGPRRRAAVAHRLTLLLNHDAVQPIPSGWLVRTATGYTEVCRTYDHLVAVIANRTGVPRDAVAASGLPPGCRDRGPSE